LASKAATLGPVPSHPERSIAPTGHAAKLEFSSNDRSKNKVAGHERTSSQFQRMPNWLRPKIPAARSPFHIPNEPFPFRTRHLNFLMNDRPSLSDPG
jgi:hypothetical protein